MVALGRVMLFDHVELIIVDVGLSLAWNSSYRNTICAYDRKNVVKHDIWSVIRLDIIFSFSYSFLT